MFIDFFYLLRSYGVPVSLTEWMALMEALSLGMAHSSLYGFYCLARAVLVKSEAYYDRYDQAFQHYFEGIETSEKLTEKVLEWLENALPPLHISPEERQLFQEWDLDELRRQLEERLKEQKGQHHGGSKWIGTGGRSPFGHSGYHPAGVRLGGRSVNKSAVKVAAERNFRSFRTDEVIGVRQFEVALRKLRQLSSRVEGPLDELDIEETIESTAEKGGLLHLTWTRSRKNTMKVILLMDSGGSMFPYMRICSQLFTAMNRASHFKDLRFYFFHNCVYDDIFLDPYCRQTHKIKTEQLLNLLEQDYKLIVVGDASMAPSELLMVNGAIDWNMYNEEPGILWLQRIAAHFHHAVWLNPILEEHWEWTEGYYTIARIKEIFPMYELTVEGLDQAIKKLKVKI
ncbi:MAG: VWA domain-containing protein [Firmicutes bacterium]|nr:VWA domain-containing protein [Bacillota bacterium]